ncbi:MAG TPA: hypothetical protein VFH51_16575, partial [Myxococcota bacterium]|nr:hypothetical protein [Myxococcota bacterium]
MRQIWLPVALLLFTLPTPAGASEEDDKLDLEGLLRADDVPDASGDLSVDVDRWVLHDLLIHDFAQTEDWQRRLEGGGLRPDAAAPRDW